MNNAPAGIGAERLLDLVEVMDRTSLSKVQIYRLINWGRFPRQVHIGPRRVAFVEREVESWIAARIAERDAKS